MTQISWQLQPSNRAGGYIVTNTDWNDVAGDLRAFIDQTTSSASDNTPLPIGIDLVNDRVYISDPDSTTPEDGNHADTTLSVVGTTTLTGDTQQTGAFTVGVNDTGHDVQFFGAADGAYMKWNQATDDLQLVGAAGLDVEGDVDVDGTTNLDAVDIDGAVDIANTLTITGDYDFTIGTANTQILAAAAGSATSGAVTYSFSGDPDTGMYRSDTNQMEWATAGVSRMMLDASGDLTVGGNPYQKGGWTAYTPTLTNWTVGNGGYAARYAQFGNTVHFIIKFVPGVTTVFSGQPYFTAPITPAALGGETEIFNCRYQTGGTLRGGGARFYGSGDNRIAPYYTDPDNLGTWTALSPTVPWSWSAGMGLLITGTYEAA